MLSTNESVDEAEEGEPGRDAEHEELGEDEDEVARMSSLLYIFGE